MLYSVVRRSSRAVSNGVASVASPYRSPGHSLNLYDSQASLAGRWSFLVLFAQFSARPSILTETCAESSPEGQERVPSISFGSSTWSCRIGAIDPSGRGTRSSLFTISA